MSFFSINFADKLKNISYYKNLLAYFEEEFLLGIFTEVAIVIFTLSLAYAASKFLTILAKRLEKTDNHWDDILVKALKLPVIMLVIVIGITESMEISGVVNNRLIHKLSVLSKEFVFAFSVGWFLISYVGFFEKRIIYSKRSKGEKVDYGTIDGVSKLVKFLIFLATFIVILDVLGVNIKGIVAAAGIGGVALGFASKDLLANFFGTTIIYLDKPFTIGDWIKSPDKDIEGTVEEIGWRMTKIRKFDKRPIYVPNSLFSTVAIENPSRMTHRRIRNIIGVRYSDVKALPKITEQVKQMLINHPEIDTNQTLIVHFEEFADWSVNFLVYTFTYTTNWIKFYEVRQDVMMKISDIISKNKASIAFPTNTLEFSNSPVVRTKK
ncbi:MAG: mechanosensitive ion channel family protein [Rickettsiales bacterium]